MPLSDRIIRAALHAAAAAIFFFLLQRFALGQDLRSSVNFAGVFAAMAAGLSWYQTRH